MLPRHSGPAGGSYSDGMPEPERPLDRLLAVPSDDLRIRDRLALGLLAATAILAIGSILALSIEEHG